ncbi:MAG: ubiquinone/menaquinone biosynthesis methyltransferase [Candidatus Thorarchaeota archaeon]|jgi:demethylmenaquinone methyltransferase/2-methoxy-6-polyprenyl-1,4-benzoquinol methylase
MSKAVQRIFSLVPHTYETVNHVLTLGLDILWRQEAAKMTASHEGNRWLEVCSGTSELSVYLSRLAREGTEIIAADYSLPMLRAAAEKPEVDRVSLALADAPRLPFPDESFDIVVISFATRNINLNRGKLTDTFREFRRVLKPGGLFVNLETSQPPSRIIRWLFHQYVRILVRPIGQLISGSRVGYGYLSHTVRHFCDAENLAQILCEAEFARIDFRHLSLGMAAIHWAVK